MIQQLKPLATQNWRTFWSRADCKALLLLLVSWWAALGYRWVVRDVELGPRIGVDYSRVKTINERIDPNTASAASLRRLPMIGPVKARQIVQYRTTHQGKGFPVFACPKDLEKVRGIGPGIIRRIKRYLQFPTGKGKSRSVQQGR